MKKFIFVVDDDVSQEELEEAIQESLPPSASINGTKKISLNNSVENKRFKEGGMSTLFKPTDIKNGVLKKMCGQKMIGTNSSWVITPLEKSQKCHSDDLKERLKGKELCDKHTSLTGVNGSGDSNVHCSNGILPECSTVSPCLKRKITEVSTCSGESKLKKNKPGTNSLGNLSKEYDLEQQKTENNSEVLNSNDTNEKLSLSAIDPDIFNSSQNSDGVQQDDHYYSKLSQSIPDDMYVALDCEMVGVGEKGRKSVLGRCSIVDYNGIILYDKYVRPSQDITDFRTPWSGIRPHHMKTAVPIERALEEIKDFLKNKIMIGHAVYNDFKVINLQPKRDQVRDTATCKLLVEWAGPTHGNGLKKLAAKILNQEIQVGKQGHCSVEDARASLNLFKCARSQWEPLLLKTWAKKGFAVELRLKEWMDNKIKKVDYLEDEFWPSDDVSS